MAGLPAAARGGRALPSLREKLRSARFVVTAEVDPPRGTDVSALVEKVRQLADAVDAFNVTDCPLANVRMSSIAAAHLLQSALGIEAIFHLTCRDRNVIGIQADLLGAAALGVGNLLILTGDPPERGNHPHARGVYEVDTPELVRLVSALNSGRTYAGGRLDSAAAFLIAVAANPNAPDLERELDRLQEKVEAGASFVQTQPVFDAGVAQAFEEGLRARGLDVPVLYGILPLRDREFARRMARIPGIIIPEEVLRRVEEGGEGEGYRLAGELAVALAGFARGVHIFPMGSAAAVRCVTDALMAARGR